MKHKFGIFIISHGRSNNMLTYNSLLEIKCNPKDIYVVIDDTDDQAESYKEKYENVVVFDKQKMYDKCDTIDNFHKLSSALYARNYCFELAKELGLDYFALLDDDIRHFQVRYENNRKLAAKEIQDGTDMFEKCCNFLENTKVVCLGFGNEGGFIGGLNGKFSNGYGRTINQAMILKADTDMRFIGTQNEDLNITLANPDKVILETYTIAMSSPVRGSNSGGNQDWYDCSGMYVCNFYPIIVNPSACLIVAHNDKITLKKKMNNIVPKILAERWKK